MIGALILYIVVGVLFAIAEFRGRYVQPKPISVVFKALFSIIAWFPLLCAIAVFPNLIDALGGGE